MKVVDLFSGLGGFSEAFVRHGHEVVRFDNDSQFQEVLYTVIKDVRDLKAKDIKANIILASPPCQCFSTAAAAMKEKRVYVRNVFDCCRLLKHGPQNRYIKKYHKDAQLILGLKVGDGAINRGYRMRELQHQNTLYRRQVKNGLLYYYPLRDCRNNDIAAVLAEFGFEDVKSSGCSKCPIFCLFPKWRKKDSLTWLRSVTYARKLGIEFYGTDQTELEQFCKG